MLWVCPMASGLTLAVSVIFNPMSITKDIVTRDPRYDVMKGVISELRSLGHTILVFAAAPTKARLPEITSLQREGRYKNDTVDAVVLWWAYKGYVPDAPTVYYENGFTHGDVVVDPSGLLGSSFYQQTLNERADRDCADWIDARLKTGAWSKRPQETAVDISVRDYVLVPTQKLLDLSVMMYSNTSMQELLRKTARFCRDKGLPLVVKIHPHVRDHEQKRQRRIVQVTVRNIHNNIHISNASIGYLAQHALFTVVLNGGTIVDALFVQAPILTTAPSLFSHTDAVVYDEDVNRGLHKIYDEAKNWTEHRKLRQRQIVCWLVDNSMNDHKSPTDNIAVLQRHFDAKFPGQVPLLPH